jgi:hypothetical protein
MTTTSWSYVTTPARFCPDGLVYATGQLTYVSATPMTTSDHIGPTATTTAGALIIPAGSTLVAAYLDSNQVDTSGSGAFNVGFTGSEAAIMSAASVASATTNNRIINVAPTRTSSLIVTGRGLYFAADTAIYITPSTNVSTVNVSGGEILLTLVYTNGAPYGV